MQHLLVVLLGVGALLGMIGAPTAWSASSASNLHIEGQGDTLVFTLSGPDSIFAGVYQRQMDADYLVRVLTEAGPMSAGVNSLGWDGLATYSPPDPTPHAPQPAPDGAYLIKLFGDGGSTLLATLPVTLTAGSMSPAADNTEQPGDAAAVTPPVAAPSDAAPAAPVSPMGIVLTLDADGYTAGDHPTATVTNHGSARIIPLLDVQRGAPCGSFWPLTVEALTADGSWTRVVRPRTGFCTASADAALCLPGKSFAETVDLDLDSGTYRIAFPLQDYDSNAEDTAYSATFLVQSAS